MSFSPTAGETIKRNPLLLVSIRFNRYPPPAFFFEIPRRLRRFGRRCEDRPRVVLEELEPRTEVFSVPEPAGNGECRTEERGGEFRNEFFRRIGRLPKPTREVAVESAFMSRPVGVLVQARRVVVRGALEGFRRWELDTIEGRRIARPVADMTHIRPDHLQKRLDLFDGVRQGHRLWCWSDMFRQSGHLFDVKHEPPL